MMGDNKWTKLRSADELEYGHMMGVMWNEPKGENWVNDERIR